MPNPEYRKTLERIGHVTVVWNRIEVLWYLIYTCLLYETPRPKIDAIYKDFRTFAAQRQFTRKLSDVAFAKHKQLKTRLGELNDFTEALAKKRNDVIHGDYTIAIEDLARPFQSMRLQVAPGGDRRARQNRLALEPDLNEKLLVLVNDAAALERDLENFRRQLLREFVVSGVRLPDELLQELPSLIPAPAEADSREGFPRAP